MPIIAPINLTLVFFVYGLAFFSMGLTLMLESGRSPFLAEARVLRSLALFGFLHGLHEWLEMSIQAAEWFQYEFFPGIDLVRLVLLTFSFIFLIAFGFQSLRPQRHPLTRVFWVSTICLMLYAFLGLLMHLNSPHSSSEVIVHADVLSRYTLAFPGAVLAALALGGQSRQAGKENRCKLSVCLKWTSASFALYSVTQIFVPYIDIFPASVVNTALFLSLTGVPIQIMRAVLAVVITVSLIRAIQEVDLERQAEFLEIQQARLDALEQIRQDLVEQEAMRRELLRHTVIAQEDERARIARELHDEMAQILTAFTLHLAVLRDSLPVNPKATESLGRLQGLSHQMSQGIYRLVHDLRPAQLDDLGLEAALQVLADEQRKRTGLQVILQVSGAKQRLDSLVETVFFRIAQEALTNIVRHASVKQAAMQLDFLPGCVVLRVSDEGVGFNVYVTQVPPHGWGLAGMRERAESIGGQFHIESSPGQGTVIKVTVQIASQLSSPVSLENPLGY